MLVLVLTILGSCLGRFWQKASTLSVLVLLCSGLSCGSAQTGADSDSESATGIQKSVLVLDETAAPNPVTLIPGANGVARIGAESFRTPPATHTMSSAPKAPELLMPQSPNEDSFTKPLVNELRGESVSSESTTRLAGDGANAIGTFATSNQSRQDQQSGFESGQSGGQTSTFGPQNQNRMNFQQPNNFQQPINLQQSNNLQPPNNFQQFNKFQQPGASENTFGGGATTGGLPPIRSASQSAAAGPSMQKAPRVSSLPSEWRDAPQVANRGQMNSGSQNGSLQPSYNISQPAGNQPHGNPAAGQQQNNSNQSRYNAPSAVQPTGFNQPIQNSRSNIELARTLMARYAVDNVSGGLPGEPIKLVDILRQPISTQQRQPLVHQYWETYYDWSSLVASQQYEQWLKRVPGSNSQADKSLLEAARVVAGNKVLAAEIQLGKSQSALMDYMPNRSSALLPLPNDLPLIQNYKTNYELYRSHRMMPTSLRGIDQMLPKTLELIGRRAQAVRVAKGAADQMIAALTQRQTTLASALEAGTIWRAAEQDLIASVTGYNQAIADYSLTVSQGYQTPEQIVAMLIAKPANNRQGFQNTAQNNNSGQSQSVVNNRFNQSQNQNQNQSNGGNQNLFGGQRNNFGQPGKQGGQAGQFSNGNSAGAAGSFNRNANRAFPSNGQNNNGGQPSNAQRQSVSGQFIAPATPVGNPASGQSSNFGSYGPQLPTQQSGQGGNARSAQTPFGPGVNGFGR